MMIAKHLDTMDQYPCVRCFLRILKPSAGRHHSAADQLQAAAVGEGGDGGDSGGGGVDGALGEGGEPVVNRLEQPVRQQ